MNTNKRIAVAAAVVFLVALIFLSGKFQPKPSISQSQPPVAVDKEDTKQYEEQKKETDSRITRLPDGRTLYNASVAKGEMLYEDPDPVRDLEIVSEILSDYVLIFREKPFGSENQEIVAQLLGQNSKKLVFLSPNSPAISPEMELLDRWGSPLVFHPLTTVTMDLHSLGPDKVIWTGDDLSLPFEALEEELQLQPGSDSL